MEMTRGVGNGDAATTALDVGRMPGERDDTGRAAIRYAQGTLLQEPPLWRRVRLLMR